MEPVTKLVISRYWNNPTITVCIDSEKIEVRMTVEDFCKAIVAEIPHPSKTMTRTKLEKNILGVLETVLNKAKEATAQV
jgi:hypothetical protein